MTKPMLCQDPQLLRYGNPDSATFLSAMAPLSPTPETNIGDCLIKPDWAP